MNPAAGAAGGVIEQRSSCLIANVDQDKNYMLLQPVPLHRTVFATPLT
jgi:hypothetical protein